jgi:hypothetical protein
MLHLTRKTIGAARTILVVTLAAFVCVGVASPFAEAQTNQTKVSAAGNNLEISPLRTDITLSPGEARSVSVFVKNLDSKPVTLKPIENDFIAGDDEAGIPEIILDEDEFAPTHSLKRFMSPLGVITVQGGERKEVKVVISVPRSASAGGYYGALRFAPSRPDGTSIVNVSASVASLIVLSVPGNVTESMEMTGFEILQDNKKVTRLSSAKNVKTAIRLENKGNIQLAPYGVLSVLKGGRADPVFTANINNIKPAGLVLPDSTRKFEIPIEKLGSFGKYTFKVYLGYGTNNQTIEYEKSIWIVPTTYIVGGVVGGAFLILLIVIIVLALRSYKKRVLRHARRR